MGKFKGTPGPWHFKYSEECDTDRGSFTGRDGMQVCWFGDSETYYPTDGTEPSHEDIALIAAAPDLLEALQGAEKALFAALDNAFGEELANGNRELIQARAAIAKALGQ